MRQASSVCQLNIVQPRLSYWCFSHKETCSSSLITCSNHSGTVTADDPINVHYESAVLTLIITWRHLHDHLYRQCRFNWVTICFSVNAQTVFLSAAWNTPSTIRHWQEVWKLQTLIRLLSKRLAYIFHLLPKDPKMHLKLNIWLWDVSNRTKSKESSVCESEAWINPVWAVKRGWGWTS